jgi:hypothetical protein
MKTSILSLFALTISAALAIPVQAGDNGHGGGGGIGFSGSGGHPSSAAHSAGPSFRGSPGAGFRGSRFMAPGRHFSSAGMRSPNSFRQQRFAGANNHVSAHQRQDQGGTINHREDRTGRIGSHGSGAARDHVFARHTANWHRDWDRGRDHWWHGHRCRFVNGEWFIFDLGFYPWYPYGYPYDYYSYGDDPYQDDSGAYEGDADYYSQGAYDSSDQNADSTIAAAQEQLARQGYYRGQIDGTFGPETRRAIMRYQSNHGLRVTGYLTEDTMRALGLPRVASN